MKTFLHYVAQDIIKKYGTDQMNVTINMPARNIIYEMVAHKEDILKNISNSERS